MDWSDERGFTRIYLTPDDLFHPVETINMLQDLLGDGERLRVRVDMSEIKQIQSIQIGTLVAMHMTAYENLSIMRFENMHPRVKELLQMVGLDKIIESHHGPKVMKQSLG